MAIDMNVYRLRPINSSQCIENSDYLKSFVGTETYVPTKYTKK